MSVRVACRQRICKAADRPDRSSNPDPQNTGVELITHLSGKFLGDPVRVDHLHPGFQRATSSNVLEVVKYMQRRDLLGGLLAYAGIQSGVRVAGASGNGFTMWQCMRWNNLPASFASCGFEDMTIFYESSMVSRDEPDYAKINKVVASIRASRPRIVTLDIECWDPAVAATREKLIRVIEYIRDRVPSSVQMGYWGIMPGYAYTDYLAGGSRLRAQRALNHAMRPLAAKVDWIMPSLYTYEGNRSRWARFASIQLDEARAYGKPVMPWLWMQFFEKTPYRSLHYRLLPGGYFRDELEMTRVRADSVCLWGTRVAQNGGRVQRLSWQRNATWWVQTKAFMQANGYDMRTCRL